MQEKRLSIRIAGNTYNSALLALRSKGYKLKLEYTKNSDENGLFPYLPDWDAEKDGCVFSATNPVELLGLVAMWETRGNNWKTQDDEPILYNELLSSAKVFDLDGNELEK